MSLRLPCCPPREASLLFPTLACAIEGDTASPGDAWDGEGDGDGNGEGDGDGNGEGDGDGEGDGEGDGGGGDDKGDGGGGDDEGDGEGDGEGGDGGGGGDGSGAPHVTTPSGLQTPSTSLTCLNNLPVGQLLYSEMPSLEQ